MTRLVKVALTVVAILAIGTAVLVAQTKPPVTPIRGDAEIGVLTPVTSVDHKAGMVRTTIKVKNLSPTHSIAGLKVEEFWFDKGGNPVTGSRARLPKPLHAARGRRAEARDAEGSEDGSEHLHLQPRERQGEGEEHEGVLARHPDLHVPGRRQARPSGWMPPPPSAHTARRPRPSAGCARCSRSRPSCRRAPCSTAARWS